MDLPGWREEGGAARMDMLGWRGEAGAARLALQGWGARVARRGWHGEDGASRVAGRGWRGEVVGCIEGDNKLLRIEHTKHSFEHELFDVKAKKVIDDPRRSKE
ncbi:hypothetical protein Fmac_012860 [Flemingia macrophylla]|uniref:Uncharacterized protein n=1 Tax=Flemingia macrophylla TaxID=520843 RepID=A0ABD1MRH1_9FABA